jgi:DNA-binding GntR family transcriptional regulator
MKKEMRKLNKQQFSYQVIRERIMDGTYAPGQRIVTSQLADELSVSVIPIREALKRLEEEELIQYIPNSGAIVTPIDHEKYLEALSVLAVLSGYATALSARSFPKEKLKDLEKINKEMSEALDEFDLRRFGSLNRAFHREIYQYCHNSFLLQTIESVHEQIDSIRRMGSAFIPVRARESVEEHKQIISMIEKDAPFSKIDEYARNHKLNTVKAYRKRMLRQNQPEKYSALE